MNYVEELKQFVLFLTNVWGILSSISVFFPLSNVLLGVVPLGEYDKSGVFDQLSSPLVTLLATIVTLFVVLATFAGRNKFRDPLKRTCTLRAAWLSFGSGFLSLLVYLVVYQVYREYAWDSWGWGSGDPRKLFIEVPLLITYVVFFSFLTRAFMLLGMLEFFAASGNSGHA